METKYIFLDIDGTLVDFQGKLADSALEALKAAKANGHKLFVCTGRQRSQIYPWLLEKITFDGAVCSSGAYVMADGECIAGTCFSKEYMTFLARYFTSLHAPLLCADRAYAHARKMVRGRDSCALSRRRHRPRQNKLALRHDYGSRECVRADFRRKAHILRSAQGARRGCRRPRGALRRRALQLRQHGRPLRRGYGQQIHKGHRYGGDTAPLRRAEERDDSLRRRRQRPRDDGTSRSTELLWATRRPPS